MTKTTKRNFVRRIFAVAAIAGGVATSCLPAAAENVQWTMTSWGGGLWLEMGAKNFAERINLLTEGRVKIDVATPGMIGSPLKVTETVQTGLAEVGLQWPAYDTGTDKAGVIFAGWSGGLTPEEYMLWKVVASWRGNHMAGNEYILWNSLYYVFCVFIIRKKSKNTFKSY